MPFGRRSSSCDRSAHRFGGREMSCICCYPNSECVLYHCTARVPCAHRRIFLTCTSHLARHTLYSDVLLTQSVRAVCGLRYICALLLIDKCAPVSQSLCSLASAACAYELLAFEMVSCLVKVQMNIINGHSSTPELIINLHRMGRRKPMPWRDEGDAEMICGKNYRILKGFYFPVFI